jgi:hypothetical protein
VKTLFIALFLPLAAFAQGTVQFVWHGNSNFFNASFIVTAAEMQGAPLGSPEFTNSVSASSLSGILYNSKDENLVTGRVNPWSFEISFLDFNHAQNCSWMQTLFRSAE